MPLHPLTLGLRHPLHIRHEHLAPHPHPCRLLYISDIHLRPRRSLLLSQQLLLAARTANPHLILLGGDLLDSPSELPHLHALSQQLAALAPLFAIAGNHDLHTGLPTVQATLESAGATWIHTSTALHTHHHRTLALSGPLAPPPPPADLHILCAHNPRIWRSAKHQHFHLVLAGHLHGCQAVAFHFKNRLFPGAFFYPYNFLSHRHHNTTLLVSRGVSDLIPIRWRCPREVLLVHL